MQTEWLKLMCQSCGHWKVGQFEKADVADWLRAHPMGVIRFDESHIERASTCPHPCGTPIALHAHIDGWGSGDG